jgi:cytochrome c551/c552/cytochrome c5
MSRCSSVATRLAVVAAFAIAVSSVVAAPYGFGKPATPQEVAGWDIDVRPDGTGLPPGRGSVAQGQAIFDEKCASCHGTFGESNSTMQIAGGVGSLASDQPVRTTGSKLNHATTLWDYINRAMPFGAPQTLQPDEVYALTAYVLNLNDIVPADTVLDRESLPKLRMPNRDGFTTDHGFMRANGKPDTHNVACMRNCVTTIRLSSEIPDYARDQHGNLVEQKRDIGGVPGVIVAAAPAAARTATPSTPLGIAKAAACMACHGIDQKVVGPGFRQVSARYAGQPGAQARLLDKLRQGGGGDWGAVPMPPQPQLQPRDAEALVAWILDGAK